MAEVTECLSRARTGDTSDQITRLVSFRAEKQSNLVAVSTPVPGANGRVSPKTPIFHLPVYKISLELDNNQSKMFFCDLADMCDLVDKIRRIKSRSSGSIKSKSQ